MAEQIKIDADQVQAAYSSVAQNISDLETRVNRFVALVEEQNNSTGGKFTILSTLNTRLGDELANLKKINEKVDDIAQVISKLIERAEEANSDDELNALAD